MSSPYLKVDINCTKCGRLMALSNARHVNLQYLCSQCDNERNAPTEKNPAIEALLTETSPMKLSRQEAHQKNLCTWCGKFITVFRDELSEKEYTLSGFCQKCQDETFGR